MGDLVSETNCFSPKRAFFICRVDQTDHATVERLRPQCLASLNSLLHDLRSKIPSPILLINTCMMSLLLFHFFWCHFSFPWYLFWLLMMLFLISEPQPHKHCFSLVLLLTRPCCGWITISQYWSSTDCNIRNTRLPQSGHRNPWRDYSVHASTPRKMLKLYLKDSGRIGNASTSCWCHLTNQPVLESHCHAAHTCSYLYSCITQDDRQFSSIKIILSGWKWSHSGMLLINRVS